MEVLRTPTSRLVTASPTRTSAAIVTLVVPMTDHTEPSADTDATIAFPERASCSQARRRLRRRCVTTTSNHPAPSARDSARPSHSHGRQVTPARAFGASDSRIITPALANALVFCKLTTRAMICPSPTAIDTHSGTRRAMNVLSAPAPATVNWPFACDALPTLPDGPDILRHPRCRQGRRRRGGVGPHRAGRRAGRVARHHPPEVRRPRHRRRGLIRGRAPDSSSTCGGGFAVPKLTSYEVAPRRAPRQRRIRRHARGPAHRRRRRSAWLVRPPWCTTTPVPSSCRRRCAPPRARSSRPLRRRRRLIRGRGLTRRHLRRRIHRAEAHVIRVAPGALHVSVAVVATPVAPLVGVGVVGVAGTAAVVNDHTGPVVVPAALRATRARSTSSLPPSSRVDTRPRPDWS